MKWVARTSISIRELGVIRENFLKVNDTMNAIHAREENRRERKREVEKGRIKRIIKIFAF